MSNNRRQMICLDIIRIFACFCVMSVHIAIVFNIPGRIGQIMESGSNGLGIFYILSAFLIFTSLDNRKDSLGSWYVKRMLRILPMYYFCIVVYMIIYTFIIKEYPSDPNHLYWLSYFLGINTIVAKSEVFWFNIGALSSMSVFAWFYILAPAIRKLVKNWNCALIFLVISYLMLRVLQLTNVLQMFCAYYYFAIGILIYYAIKEGKEKSTTIITLCVLVFLILADGKGGLLYGLVIGLLIMYTYDVDIKNNMLCMIIRFLSSRAFAIYLAHAMVMQLMDFMHISRDIKGFMYFALYTVILVVILHEIVEKGFTKAYSQLRRSDKSDR